MQIHTTSGGRLHIYITLRELRRLGADGAVFSHPRAQTHVVLCRILRAVRRKVGIPTDTAMRITAVSTANGYVLRLTPALSLPQHDGIYLVRLSAETCTPFLAACKRQLRGTVLSCSLYTLQDTPYLLLYLTSPPPRALLTEFAVSVNTGKRAAAFITEYGKPVYIGDTLERL